MFRPWKILYLTIAILLISGVKVLCQIQQQKTIDTSSKITKDRPGINSVLETPKAKPVEPFLTEILILDFYTTFTASKYDNGESNDQKNQLYFYYNFTVNNTFKNKYFIFRTYLYDEFGLKYYQDSVNSKSDDKYVFRNSFQKIFSTHLSAQITATIQSQVWKTYTYLKNTNNGMDKILYTDYFSPGYIIYSSGLSYRFMQSASMDLGLVGGRVTEIKNQNIYTSRNAEVLYGLKKGQHKKFVYGINLQVNAPPVMINKHLGWELNGVAFISKDSLYSIKGGTLSLNNAFHILFLKNIRLSWRTEIEYDQNIQAKVFIANQIAVGFYLNNHF